MAQRLRCPGAVAAFALQSAKTTATDKSNCGNKNVHRRRLSCFTLQLSDKPSIAAFCACFAVVCLLVDPSLNILGSIQISSIGCKDCHYRQDVSPFHLFEVAF